MAKKTNDEIKVCVCIDISVNRAEWIKLMESKGLDTSIVLPAFLGDYVKKLVRKKFAELGFPQP